MESIRQLDLYSDMRAGKLWGANEVLGKATDGARIQDPEALAPSDDRRRNARCESEGQTVGSQSRGRVSAQEKGTEGCSRNRTDQERSDCRSRGDAEKEGKKIHETEIEARVD